jgi:hypothetical protein
LAKVKRSAKEFTLKQSHRGTIKVKIIKSVTMGKVDKHENIRGICGFSVSIFEKPKHYEAQFVYKNPNDMDSRIEKTIDYLGQEGFFKFNKRIKVTTIHLSSDE